MTNRVSGYKYEKLASVLDITFCIKSKVILSTSQKYNATKCVSAPTMHSKLT